MDGESRRGKENSNPERRRAPFVRYENTLVDTLAACALRSFPKKCHTGRSDIDDDSCR